MISKRILRPFRLLRTRWLILVNMLTVSGAVSVFGLFATLLLDMGPHNARVMLAVIPPMIAVVIINDVVIICAIGKRMSCLLDGIQAVAGGDMDVVLNTKGAEEYTEIYENFNLMVKELKATKEEMSNFTNELSHEFKTPIASIQGFAQYLEETGGGIETPKRMKYLQVIADESQRLAQLSTNMLLMSKVEACQVVTDKERFDLGEQIRHCVILLLPQMEKKLLELELSLPELPYYGNQELLEQVWINLLSNAIKFTPEHGEITVTGQMVENMIRIAITDSGIGMDEETRSHIFEKYYQRETKRTTQGNGIGLSIAQRIVTLCQGQIAVTSIPGAGSTFSVMLPTRHA